MYDMDPMLFRYCRASATVEARYAPEPFDPNPVRGPALIRSAVEERPACTTRRPARRRWRRG